MSSITFLDRKFIFGGRKAGGKKQGASPLRDKNSLRRKSELRRESEPRRVRAPVAAAASKKTTKSERKSWLWPQLPWGQLSWEQLSARALPVLAVTLVIGLIAGGWKLLDYVGSVPVSRVAVTGTLQHVDRDLLVQRVRTHLNGAGFMTVDLDAIRADIVQLPWVAGVSIQRRWPDQLVIEVTEQEAIARWGKDGLLNRRGEVFRPQPLGDVAQLPVLYGPDNLSGEVVERYAQLRDLLSEQKLMLSDLGSDERGSWSATLQDGVVLRLGTGDILKKMRSFSRVYRAELSAQMERIAYIDLRYSNGLAVGWKNSDWKAADAKAAAYEKSNTNSGVSGHG